LADLLPYPLANRSRLRGLSHAQLPSPKKTTKTDSGFRRSASADAGGGLRTTAGHQG
jgi:hypothetical protein